MGTLIRNDAREKPVPAVPFASLVCAGSKPRFSPESVLAKTLVVKPPPNFSS